MVVVLEPLVAALDIKVQADIPSILEVVRPAVEGRALKFIIPVYTVGGVRARVPHPEPLHERVDG
jgi:hypothetical protein